MKEIPLMYVRVNQWGLVVTILASIIFNISFLIVALFLIQLVGLRFGLKFNLFIQFARALQLDKLKSDKTESAELQKFNNSIAVILLGISTLLYVLSTGTSIIGETSSVGLLLASKIAASMVACAAFLAICGYCIGCVIYYRYKRYTALH